jgi:hypothetical protein
MDKIDDDMKADLRTWFAGKHSSDFSQSLRLIAFHLALN